MNLAEKAHAELFPDRVQTRTLSVSYSGRFKGYNANVRFTARTMDFAVAKEWREVSEEIQQGLFESLLCKVYGEKRSSSNQDLYRSFMKHLSGVARVESKDAYLLGRFRIINERFFGGMMSEPNLIWGQTTRRKLGHYAYATDTILISGVFRDASVDPAVEGLLDFVLYHEMLHKKHSYDHKKARPTYHSTAFKEEERAWPDRDIERKMTTFLRASARGERKRTSPDENETSPESRSRRGFWERIGF
jgi:hypothetical protein